MKFLNKNVFSANLLVPLKGEDWLHKQRIAGKIVADALLLLENEVKSETSLSLIELNNLAETLILDRGATATFKDYKGFPAGVCISVNHQLVHGIPTEYHLQPGDLVSFDLGATYQGAIADSALTCVFQDEHSKYSALIKATEEALFRGIQAIGVGKQLNSIGHAISRSTKHTGYGLITDYGGHGLDWNQPHAPPFVSNKGETNDGIRIQPGLTLAIEPMLVDGGIQVKTEADGWTVSTQGVGAHFEHSLYVHEDHVEIVTYRGNERFLTSNQVFF